MGNKGTKDARIKYVTHETLKKISSMRYMYLISKEYDIYTKLVEYKRKPVFNISIVRVNFFDAIFRCTNDSDTELEYNAHIQTGYEQTLTESLKLSASMGISSSYVNAGASLEYTVSQELKKIYNTEKNISVRVKPRNCLEIQQKVCVIIFFLSLEKHGDFDELIKTAHGRSQLRDAYSERFDELFDDFCTRYDGKVSYEDEVTTGGRYQEEDKIYSMTQLQRDLSKLKIKHSKNYIIVEYSYRLQDYRNIIHPVVRRVFSNTLPVTPNILANFTVTTQDENTNEITVLQENLQGV